MKFLEDVSLSACVPRPETRGRGVPTRAKTRNPRDRARPRSTGPAAARENARARTFFHSFAGSKKMGPKGRTGRDPSRPRSRV
jgi:hypothetical protein